MKNSPKQYVTNKQSRKAEWWNMMFFHEIISQMVYRSLKTALLLKVCFKGESMKRVCSHKEISLLFLRKIFLSLLSVPLAWPHCFQPSQFQNPKLGMSKSQRRKGSDGSLKVPNTGQSCLMMFWRKCMITVRSSLDKTYGLTRRSMLGSILERDLRQTLDRHKRDLSQKYEVWEL